MGFLCWNDQYIGLKSLFFFVFFEQASTYRFLPLYYKDLGCRETEIGVLMGILPAISLISIPFWSAISDNSGHKNVLLFTAFLSFILFPLNYFVEFLSMSNRYVFLIILRIGYSLFNAPISTLVNVLTISQLGDNRAEYGKLRTWGTIGWGVCYAILGFIVDSSGLGIIFAFSLTSGILVVVMTSFVVQSNNHNNYNNNEIEKEKTEEVGGTTTTTTTTTTTKTTIINQNQIEIELEDKNKILDKNFEQSDFDQKKKQTNDNTCLSTIKGLLGILFQNKQTFSFFCMAFLFGAGMSLIESYLFLFIVKEFDASAGLLGIAVTLTIILEIPILFFSKSIIEKIGPILMIVLSQLSFAIRAVGYGFITHSYQMLLLEPLHGITFGLFHAAAIQYVASIAPPGLVASAQGLYSTIAFGIGYMTSMILGGWIIELFGTIPVFRVIGILCFIFSLIFWGLTRPRVII